MYPPFIDQVFGSVTSDDMKVLKFKTNNPAAGINLGHRNLTIQKGQLCPVVIDEYIKACLPAGCVATAKPWYYLCCAFIVGCRLLISSSRTRLWMALLMLVHCESRMLDEALEVAMTLLSLGFENVL